MMAGCSSKTTEEATTETTEDTVILSEAQLKNANVVTDTLAVRSISSVIKLNGKIDVPPQNMVSVSMPLGGYLTSTKLLPGMHVKKGETIAVMKDGQYIDLQQNYLTAKTRLSYLEAEYNRQKNLNSDKTSSDKVLQQTLADYETEKVLLKGLAEKLKLININPNPLTASHISGSVPVYSPIDGFVSKVDVNIGKYVNPSDILFELVNPTDIHLNLTVFEKDLSKIFIGQKLVAYTNNQPSRKIPCEIILVNKDITHEGTAEVHCHFENYPPDLLPGMYMNAEVEIKANKAFTVPDDAIVLFGARNQVFVSEGPNKFIMVPVETGTKENGFTELVNAQNLTGKKIVVKGAYTLLMALKNKQEEE